MFEGEGEAGAWRGSGFIFENTFLLLSTDFFFIFYILCNIYKSPKIE